MPSPDQPCTCTQCKAFWTYTDAQGVEHPGRMRHPKLVKRHKQRDQWQALSEERAASGGQGPPLSAQATVLLATMTDHNAPPFHESVAVRPRDEESDVESNEEVRGQLAL